jgi:hypothetical protein
MGLLRYMNLRKMGSLVAVLLVPGCGGSSSGSGSLTKTEFITAANAICSSAEEERKEALQGVSGENPEAVELTNSALPAVEKMTEELGDLGPPPGDGQKVQEIVAAYEAGIKRIEADPGNLTAAINAFTKANQLAEDYGLTDCAI